MGRGFTKSEEQLKPDPRFGDKVLARFTNCVMLDGKKTAAQRCVYGALDLIQERLEKDKVEDTEAIDVFRKAIENVKPNVEVRSRRVGGTNYQVPMQVNRKRQQSLAFRWIISACRKQKGRPMHMKLARELWDAYNKEGQAMNTRDQIHRMAEANKAFSHFAW
ncbi:MAG: 30S ribosomal protein S7 [Planctomycetota bacterium]